MARTRLGTRVGLVEGRGEHLWLRIGRIVAAACSRTGASGRTRARRVAAGLDAVFLL